MPQRKRKKSRKPFRVLALSATLAAAVLMVWLVTRPGPDSARFTALEILHPLSGAVMPRNMPAPVVFWNTNVAGVTRWSARFRAGRESRSCDGIQPMWRLPESDWLKLKESAKQAPIELTLTGYGGQQEVVAKGVVRFSISSVAVTAPIFYRDVNLPFVEAVKDPSKIRWRFGTVDTGKPPPVVLQDMIVCGNCHSFTRDGKCLAMDVDYANNKGSYAIARTAPRMTLNVENVITWDDYRRDDGQETLGLLSQISPDGRYVLSTVKDLSVFMPMPDLAFSQLFFPFMGIIGVYDRETKKFSSLPGADDRALVQSNPTWSPDGQWVVFARSRAVTLKKALVKGPLMLSREEDEELYRQTREFRYDLYRVPFNDGKGGQAEPVRGASGNGRSNYFPKFSPDGRWIVFCQASNYMLLQRDSELFVIPSEGGQAKRLGCNLGRMNSWHSWSPDSQWLVFSSKAHSDYTQLYLARIDDCGEASPPVWLAQMVEPQRAANIPEFVALPPQGIAEIRKEFLDDVSYARAAAEFLRAGDTDSAIAKFKTAAQLNPNNVDVCEMLGVLLNGIDREQSREHLERAVRLNPGNPVTRYVLGCSCAAVGDFANAAAHLEQGVQSLATGDERTYGSLDSNHKIPELLHYKLALAYTQLGRIEEAEQQYRQALALAPGYAEAHQGLGGVLLQSGEIAEAEQHFLETIRLAPGFAPAYNALGIIRRQQDRVPEALACFQKAVQNGPHDWQARLNLATTYLSQGRRDEAIVELREVLRLEPGCEPAQRALIRAQDL